VGAGVRQGVRAGAKVAGGVAKAGGKAIGRTGRKAATTTTDAAKGAGGRVAEGVAAGAKAGGRHATRGAGHGLRPHGGSKSDNRRGWAYQGIDPGWRPASAGPAGDAAGAGSSEGGAGAAGDAGDVVGRPARRWWAKRKEKKKRRRRRRLLTALLVVLLFVMALGSIGALDESAKGDTTGMAGMVSGIPYAEIFNQTAALGIDPRLVAAVAWAESSFNPDIITCKEASSAGALGIMQFMPGTADSMGIDPCKPEQAIPAGAKYLLTQHERFGSWELALAAYNAGPGAVEQHGGIPPFAETQAYVPKVMGQWREYQKQFPEELVGGGAPGEPKGSTERYTESSITPTMQRLLDAMVPQFGRGHGIGCYRDGTWGEHPKGRACDLIMTSPLNRMPTDEYLKHGWEQAKWLVANADRLGVYYVIWQEQIWSSTRRSEGWRTYTMYPNGSLTEKHYDHIHVSVLDENGRP
jgi:hypothetical protein